MKQKKLTKSQLRNLEAQVNLLSNLAIADMLDSKNNIIYKLVTVRSNLKNGSLDKTEGICNYVSSLPIVFYLSPYWPKWSECSLFPIQEKDEPGTPFEQFDKLEKWEGKQLELRLDLMKFILHNIHNFYVVLEKVKNERANT